MADTDQYPAVLLPPREVARRLGIAASTLRRLGPIYEAVHGPLPWEGGDSGGGRLWPPEAVERLGAARALVAEGRSKSLDNALRALEGGAQPLGGPLAPSGDPAALAELTAGLTAALEALQADLREVPALRAEISELQGEISGLRAELRARHNAGVMAAFRAIPAYGGGPEPETITAAGAGPDQGSISDQGADRGKAERDGPAVRAARWLERLIRR